MADLTTQLSRLKMRRQKSTPCMFQKDKGLHKLDEAKAILDTEDSDNDDKEDPSAARSKSAGAAKQGAVDKKETGGEPKFPMLVSKLRTQIRSKAFIDRTKAAVARRRRLERPWMKGDEMRPFYHLWEQEQMTPKGKKLRRVSSLPRDYRMPEAPIAKPPELGIIRECCCKIRSRLKTFPFD